MKILNIKGIILLLAALLVLDGAIAFGVSPIAKNIIVTAANKNLDPTIRVESLRIHPVLMNVSVKGLSAFNPENESERFFRAEKASVQLDIMALLRKRVWIDQLILKNVDLEVVKDSTGSLNITNMQDVSSDQTGGKMEQIKGWLTQGKRDWFSEVYDRVKAKTAKSASGKKEESKKESVKREIRELPSGRVVEFVSSDSDLFRIKKIRLDGGKVVLNDRGNKLPPIEKINILIKNYRLKKNGLSEIAYFDAKGILGGRKNGSFEASMTTTSDSAKLKLNVTDADLPALDPFFEDSLPVRFNDGFVTASVDTSMEKGKLDSYQEIKLTSHSMVPRSKVSLTGLTSGVLLQTLSKIDPLELKFRIGGTPDKPSFDGLNQTLLNIAKEQFPDASISLKEQAAEKLGDVKDKLTSFFK